MRLHTVVHTDRTGEEMATDVRAETARSAWCKVVERTRLAGKLNATGHPDIRLVRVYSW